MTHEQELKQLHIMAENNARQAVDGLKYDLARALKQDWKDSHANYNDCDPEDQLEMCKAFIESMWDNLTRFGIRPDEV